MPVSVVGSQNATATQSGRYRSFSSSRASNRKVASIERWNRHSERALEETLSAGLLATDSELKHLLHEVDEISKSLKSGTPDTQTVQLAAHPAVWCAVRQALLDRELRHLALTDDLTCLYNRRGFFAAATQQLKLARRKAESLLLFFCDVDGLKGINDSYGHQEGDLAIIRAADALERTFRNSDVLARLGGDEFVVLSVEASGQHEDAILRRLEKNLKKANANESRYELSLSVGTARFDPRRPVSLGELVARADEMMYERKRSRSTLAGSRS